MTEWLDDKRDILRVVIGNEKFDHLCGDRFERIQQNGEYCHIPWVRVRSYYSNGGLGSHERTIEAPLGKVEWIEFGEEERPSLGYSPDFKPTDNWTPLICARCDRETIALWEGDLCATCTASVDRSPEGQDAQRLDAKHESAVPAVQTPNLQSEPPPNAD